MPIDVQRRLLARAPPIHRYVVPEISIAHVRNGSLIFDGLTSHVYTPIIHHSC